MIKNIKKIKLKKRNGFGFGGDKCFYKKIQKTLKLLLVFS